MTKPPIVILHGWNLSAKPYSHLAELLQKKGYQIYIPDFPGFGKNMNLPRVLTLKDYQDFLFNYLKNKNIVKPIIVGHSFGGRVAIVAACADPDEFSGLILTGVPGFLSVPTLKVYLFLLIAKAGKLLFKLPIINKLSIVARRVLYKAAGATDYYRAEGMMRETFKKIIAQDLTSAMKQIVYPTLLVWGEKDNITPVWIGRKMTKLIPNSRLVVVSNVGHSFIYKNPDRFVKEFIKYVE